MKEEFHYVIARPWYPQDPHSSLCIYMIHNTQLQAGNMAHAQAQLNYVRLMEKQGHGDAYRIYPVSLGDPL
jgi:hypothetical protein